jgi:hypothetical protein
MSTSYEPADPQSPDPQSGTGADPQPPRGEHRATTRADSLMGRDGRPDTPARADAAGASNARDDAASARDDAGVGRNDDGGRDGNARPVRDGLADRDRLDRDDVDGDDAGGRDGEVVSEKEKYGGVKVGSAFFGWVTATGMAVLLTAAAVAAGAAVGVATNGNVSKTINQAGTNPQTVGITGAIILLVIIFVAYYCGGYVAGRMARFNGIRQGFAVWLWTVLVAIIVAIISAVGGSKFDILANLNSFPRIPLNEGQLSTAGIVALIIVAVASLVGALLGGLAGMHFHRKVDRAVVTPVVR